MNKVKRWPKSLKFSKDLQKNLDRLPGWGLTVTHGQTIRNFFIREMGISEWEWEFGDIMKFRVTSHGTSMGTKLKNLVSQPDSEAGKRNYW
jgi:hypothetical protein